MRHESRHYPLVPLKLNSFSTKADTFVSRWQTGEIKTRFDKRLKEEEFFALGNIVSPQHMSIVTDYPFLSAFIFHHDPTLADRVKSQKPIKIRSVGYGNGTDSLADSQQTPA